MNKKGVEFPFQITASGMLFLVGVIFFSLFIFGLLQASERAETKGLCSVSSAAFEVKQMETISKAYDRLIGNTQYYFSCPIHVEYFSEEEIKNSFRERDRALAEERNGYTPSELDEPLEQQRYVLNKQFATHLTDCWQKTGNRDLFSSMLNFDDYEFRDRDAIIQSGTDADTVGWLGRRWEGFQELMGLEQDRPPRFCVVCSKIYFDPEMESIQSQGTLYTYLQRHSSQYFDEDTLIDTFSQGIPEYELLKETYPTVAGYPDRYTYDTSNVQAVVYMRQYAFDQSGVEVLIDSAENLAIYTLFGPINLLRSLIIEGVIPDASDFYNQDQWGVMVVDYEDLPNHCDLLANSYE